ncbi:hypothetical protein FHS76_004298 [Ochrobactrum daejeonense]|uniref:Uncharacterized protein n=1 Tax=Brucella daejeonensis TaxID=659015 RepID=A0A7W9B1A8_9HYPH|nr:hypothetical protein [Brucella daejeonensis]
MQHLLNQRADLTANQGSESLRCVCTTCALQIFVGTHDNPSFISSKTA